MIDRRLSHRVGRSSQATTAAVEKSHPGFTHKKPDTPVLTYYQACAKVREFAKRQDEKQGIGITEDIAVEKAAEHYLPGSAHTGEVSTQLSALSLRSYCLRSELRRSQTSNAAVSRTGITRSRCRPLANARQPDASQPSGQRRKVKTKNAHVEQLQIASLRF